MDRQIVFPGQIPLDTDVLSTNVNTLKGLGALLSAIFDNPVKFDGLSVTPTAPNTLAIQVNPGHIYTQTVVDTSAYSSLPADSTPVYKSGELSHAVTLPLTAPVTAGQSVTYLIQAQFVEVDIDPLVLAYYNETNPQQALAGPGNSNLPQNTVRAGRVVAHAKPGVPAFSGSQTAPVLDAGFVPLAYVTVSAGQTAVSATSVTPIPLSVSQPFIVRSLDYLSNAPVFIGTPQAPTAQPGDSSKKLATTEFVGRAIAAYAAQLANLSAELADFLSHKAPTYAPINSPVFTGNPEAPTPAQGDNSQSLATTAFVDAALANALSGLQGALQSNGWQELPGGLMIQWGTFQTNGSGYSSLVFPRPFSTALFSITGNMQSNNTQNYAANFDMAHATVTSVPAALVSTTANYWAGIINFVAIGR